MATESDEIPVAELSYTEASRELDEIVEFFEHRDVDVDQLVARLERATVDRRRARPPGATYPFAGGAARPAPAGVGERCRPRRRGS